MDWLICWFCVALTSTYLGKGVGGGSVRGWSRSLSLWLCLFDFSWKDKLTICSEQTNAEFCGLSVWKGPWAGEPGSWALTRLLDWMSSTLPRPCSLFKCRLWNHSGVGACLPERRKKVWGSQACKLARPVGFNKLHNKVPRNLFCLLFGVCFYCARRFVHARTCARVCVCARAQIWFVCECMIVCVQVCMLRVFVNMLCRCLSLCVCVCKQLLIYLL